MGNMGSAHPLVEVNVLFKFEGNPSISKGVIERTRIGDGRTDGPTDRPTDRRDKAISVKPSHMLWWGYNYSYLLGLCVMIVVSTEKKLIIDILFNVPSRHNYRINNCR